LPTYESATSTSTYHIKEAMSGLEET